MLGRKRKRECDITPQPPLKILLLGPAHSPANTSNTRKGTKENSAPHGTTDSCSHHCTIVSKAVGRKRKVLDFSPERSGENHCLCNRHIPDRFESSIPRQSTKRVRLELSAKMRFQEENGFTNINYWKSPLPNIEDEIAKFYKDVDKDTMDTSSPCHSDLEEDNGPTEYDSFNYWKEPIPELALSELCL